MHFTGRLAKGERLECKKEELIQRDDRTADYMRSIVKRLIAGVIKFAHRHREVLMRNNGQTESSEVPKASTDLLVRRLKHSASSTRDSTTDNIHVHSEWISSSNPTPIYWPD